MPGIVSIVITDNQIADLDATSLRKLPKLNCLDLTNNSIARVPPELGLLPACKSLKLEGNCFKIPRQVSAFRLQSRVLVHPAYGLAWDAVPCFALPCSALLYLAVQSSVV